MSVFLQPIYTQTVGASPVSFINFNSIPQTFTDLKLVISSRSNLSALYDFMYIRFSGDTASNYSNTRIQGDGAASSSANQSSITASYFAMSAAATATSNTFSNLEMYLPNYTGANYKQIVTDSVTENNATNAYETMWAGLWRNTSAVSSMSIVCNTGSFVQYSTFSLYGVLRSGI